MKIIHIQHPHVILEDGSGLLISQFTNTPKVGFEAKNNGETFESVPSGDVDECVSGVCPIK